MFMQSGVQAHIAFYLSGMRSGSGLDAIDGLGLRPALLAGYRDLTRLRYDFPLVLIRDGAAEACVQPLSAIVDAALNETAVGLGAADLRRQAIRLEQEIRVLLSEGAGGALSSLWTAAAARLNRDEDGLSKVRAAIKIDGEVVDCDRAMPFRLCHHVWQTVQNEKIRRFRENIGKLITKLADILRADFLHSPEGLGPEILKMSVGAAHHGAFDFDALSRLLTKTYAKDSLSDSRRRRIRWLLNALEEQRFYPPFDESGEHHAPFGFVFESCADAIAAYHERLPKMVELTRAIAMAGLEIDGEYYEQRHEPFFANFDVENLSSHDFDLFPDYLILVHAAEMQASDTEMLLEAFSAGMRAKVLVQTDDLLRPSSTSGGGFSLGLRARQLANSAMGMGGFWVLQSPASKLAQFRERIAYGFSCSGPALFSVYSGAAGNDLPPYLNAAAALESRAFPAFIFDPSAGPDCATRLCIECNPQSDREWPSYVLTYEDAEHQKVSETVTFTLADLVACDPRYARHFARVPREAWNGSLAPAASLLAPSPGNSAGKVPCLLMVDADNALQKVIADERCLRETRRCGEMWRSLQKLGGFIAFSDGERRAATERGKAAEAAHGGPAGVNGVAVEGITPSKPAMAEAAIVAGAEQEAAPGHPYIETVRCSSCNECTRINSRMFAYDANKQAYIKDPDAGPYRHLVEAAENCPLAIIHPGLPRDPDEPGLVERVPGIKEG